jgi:rhamnulose-1-phosphate aldolase
MDKNSLNLYFKSIGYYANILNYREWSEAGSGNISQLIDPDELKSVYNDETIFKSNKLETFKTKSSFDNLDNFGVLITNSGARMREITQSPSKFISLLKIEKNNKFKIIHGNSRITSEWESHIGLYNEFISKNKVQRAIIHIHPPEIIAFTHIIKNEKKINSILKEMLNEMKIFLPEGVGFIEHLEAGSEKLSIATVKKFKSYTISFWEKHGIISSGETLNHALDNIEIVNQAVKIFFKVHSIA